MPTLMGHLAHFSSFSRQGEVLCTQGFAFLLNDAGARAVFVTFIRAAGHTSVDDDLLWRAESRQADRGRPDLEARRPDGTPIVKIEAKLSAEFGNGQLVSYVDDLKGRNVGGMLLVLVPAKRLEYAVDAVQQAFALAGPGPWRLRNQPEIAVAIITWEGVLEALGTVKVPTFEGDLQQFKSMYRTLNGDDIAPVTTDTDWREREVDFVNLVDRVTRRLLEGGKLLPMAREEAPTDYFRRYVCRVVGSEQPCFSIGTCDPFAPRTTPVWLRFHATTPMFSVIRERLMASELAQQVVTSSAHLWLPLEVPKNSEADVMVQSITSQVDAVIRIAYGP